MNGEPRGVQLNMIGTAEQKGERLGQVLGTFVSHLDISSYQLGEVSVP